LLLLHLFSPRVSIKKKPISALHQPLHNWRKLNRVRF
jgi:hypothetical protein